MSSTDPPKRLLARDMWFAALMGVLTTVLHFRGFGVGDQAGQLPIILRALDANYLPNDFFTNAAANSVARRGYAWLIAHFATQPADLPGILALLCLACNVAMACITVLAARRLCPRNPKAGLFAAALAMSVSTFELGWSSTIYFEYLVPSQIAISLVMAAFVLALEMRIVLSMALCALAALIHPLVGLEIGALIWASFVVSRLYVKEAMGRPLMYRVIGAALVMVLAGFVLLVPYLGRATLPGAEFVRIVAFVRNPHHHVPSAFAILQWPTGVAVVAYSVTLFVQGRRSRAEHHNAMVAAFSLAIIALCVGGYVFVEVWPSRLWATAQVYRLLYFVKWLGLVVVGGMLGELIEEPMTLVVGCITALNPLSLCGFCFGREALQRMEPRWRERLTPTFFLCATAASCGLWLVFPQSAPTLITWLGSLCLVHLAATARRFRLLRIMVSAAMMVLACRFWYTRAWAADSGLPHQAPWLDAASLDCTLGSAGDDLAAFARQNTPPDCIMATPPEWGQFRLLADRAIVVDFKAIVYSDEGLKEWYRRIVDCYGEPAHGGVLAKLELSENWSQVTEDHLAQIGDAYDADYAVLYAQSLTSMPVLYANDKFKLVAIH